jgi:hypothetical protein
MAALHVIQLLNIRANSQSNPMAEIVGGAGSAHNT